MIDLGESGKEAVEIIVSCQYSGGKHKLRG
jgi:hypothetical protein